MTRVVEVRNEQASFVKKNFHRFHTSFNVELAAKTKDFQTKPLNPVHASQFCE